MFGVIILFLTPLIIKEPFTAATTIINHTLNAVT